MRDLRAIRLVVATLAAIVGSVVVVAQATAMVLGAASSAPPEGAAFEVSDDDAGVALFSVAGMRPEVPATNCISVAHRTVSGNNALRLALHGSAVGDLANHLGFRVEVGTGGRFGDCSTFQTSAVLYDGTLAGFTTEHVDTASAVAVEVPERDGQLAYRLTSVLASAVAAQGQSAEATFTWEALSGAALPTPTTVVTTTPATTPAATQAAEPAPVSTPATAPAPAAPRAVATPATPVAAVPAPAATPPEEPVSVVADPPAARATVTAPPGARREAARRAGAVLEPVVDEPTLAARAAAVATEVAKRGSFPAVLLLILLGFLLLQDLIDRRDPKLALAPLHAEPDVMFDDPSLVRAR